ncbi:MAG: Nramp family divalent metal transporter [Dehalococcoidia bacterium]|nr:Nramp family divalent metal transporter [Dehalococcoidia bacterium]
MGEEAEREVAVRRPGAVPLGLLARISLFLAVMGPGMITGIVDDDPTGIAGYSIAGSRFGYSMLWAIVLCVIALAVIAEIAARLGAVTGRGLADLIRERFGVRITALAMLVLLVANATTTIAEFAGVAGASEIFGVSKYATVPLAAALVLALVVFGTYHRVEKVLLLGSLVFVSYIIAGFLARPDWGEVATHSVVPTFHFSLPYITILIGVIGTTITPWQQFYLQSGVVDKGLGEREYRFVRWDVYAGAIACTLIAFFVIVTTAATLNAHGEPAGTVTEVGHALHPLAGDFAANLFAIGLLNASLLAATVLPLSTAYAVCGAFGWERSVNRRLREAPAFFGLFAALVVGGAAVVLIPGLPLLTLLFLPNVVGGILLPVILVLMLKLVNDRRIMGSWINSRRQNAIAWTTTVVLVALAVVYAVIALLQVAGIVNA